MLSSLATFCAPASFALNTARPTSLGTIATLMVAELLPLALGAPEVDPLLHPATRPVNRLVAAPITNNVRTLLTISISYLSCVVFGFMNGSHRLQCLTFLGAPQMETTRRHALDSYDHQKHHRTNHAGRERGHPIGEQPLGQPPKDEDSNNDSGHTTTTPENIDTA